MSQRLLSLARWTQRDLLRLAAQEQRPQLLTIPYSHYCELASWALDLGGGGRSGYREHGFAPGEHVLPALRLRVAGATPPVLAKTSRVDAMPRTREEVGVARPRPRSNATAVPALALPDGRVLEDSWAIAEAYLGPFGDADFKALLDEDVGPLSRQWVYEVLFRRDNKNVWDALACHGRGRLFRAAWAFGSPDLTDGMRRLFRADDAAAMALCRERLWAAVAAVDARLGERRGGYLGGDSPSVDDVAVAALLAPIASPKLYVRGDYAAVFAALLDQDADARSEVEAFRETAAGAHAMMMYARHRVV